MSDASNAPWVPYPTRFDDLNDNQSQSVEQACLFARRRIADAINLLKGARNRITPEVATHFRIGDTSAASKADLQTAISTYYVIVDALLGHQNLGFEGETSGPYGAIGDALGQAFRGSKPEAYVWSTSPPNRGDEGIVHLVSHRVFGRPLPEQARIIIHEVGHRFAGLQDKKGYHASRVININREDALVNADTYAHFAIPRPQGPSLKVAS